MTSLGLDVLPDRLEEIARRRAAHDPDIRWLCQEVLALRDSVDREHHIALELARLAIQRLLAVTSEVAAVIDMLQGESDKSAA